MTLGSESYQVRVFGEIAGWFTIDNTSSPLTGALPSTTGGSSNGGGTLLTTFTWEYFTCTPGQTLTWAATTTASGSLICFTEMS